jgi:hypothetical protein
MANIQFSASHKEHRLISENALSKKRRYIEMKDKATQ